MNDPKPLGAPRPEITEALGLELAARVATHGASAEMLTVMRFEHPGVRFTACSENDVPALLQPWLSHGNVNVYLLDATEHCVSLTKDPAIACGMLFALNDDE